MEHTAKVIYLYSMQHVINRQEYLGINENFREIRGFYYLCKYVYLEIEIERMIKLS